MGDAKESPSYSFSLASEDVTQNARQYFTLRLLPYFLFLFFKKINFTTSITRNYDIIRYSITSE